MPIKLNLGSGFKKYPGYINVDSALESEPDIVWDLEKTPWPWEDNTIDEIKMEHVLEHLGETTAAYLNIWKEMYRICKNDAYIHITVPHWHHDNFYGDPTHKRPITPNSIRLFDQALNIQEIEEGISATKLGLFTGIDLELREEDVQYFYTQAVADAIASGTLPREQLDFIREHQNNVSNEVRMKVRIIKPGRGQR